VPNAVTPVTPRTALPEQQRVEMPETSTTVALEKRLTDAPASSVTVAREKKLDLPISTDEPGAVQRAIDRMKHASTWAIALGMLIVVGAGLYWWNIHRAPSLPPYIVKTNGRLEFTRIDIAAKNPGRIVDLSVHEGQRAAAGEILAHQDDAELNAQLAGARAQRDQALGAIARAQAELQAHRSSEALARLESTQTENLYQKKLVSDVELQRRHLALNAEMASVAAAAAAVDESRTSLAEAYASIARLQVLLAETIIRAPIAGRIEYKVIENGAVLPPGGRVATLLDPTDVYMTVFLSSNVAGKLRIGDEARIVLDGFDGPPIPATVSFVSPEAQFTPKYVETAAERDKLVYRVKLQIPPAVAAQLDGQLKAGATGYGYVRLQTNASWPEGLLAQADGAG
jgi:HlyD family secretion protein